jgi:hypothetical protein
MSSKLKKDDKEKMEILKRFDDEHNYDNNQGTPSGNSNIFEEDDLIMYKQNGNIMSGGFKVESIILKKNISPETDTLDSEFLIENKNKGFTTPNLFQNLTVPCGLYYMEPSRNINPSNIKKYNYEITIEENDDGKEIDDDLFNKLLSDFTVEIPEKGKKGNKGKSKDIESEVEKKPKKQTRKKRKNKEEKEDKDNNKTKENSKKKTKKNRKQ